MSPSIPLHDVNVTSIYQHTRTHNLNLFIFWQIYVLISSYGKGKNKYDFLPFPPTPYGITFCFMNSILLFNNDDWIVSRLLFHSYYLSRRLFIFVRKGIDTNF